MKITRFVKDLRENEIFVFGSNELGIHGAGAAKTAKQWGARYGQGIGLMGRTYGIPTVEKLNPYTTLSLMTIKQHVDDFIQFANKNKNKIFLVTKIGCGLAGFKDYQIAPFFKNCMNMKNIHLPGSFVVIIKSMN